MGATNARYNNLQGRIQPTGMLKATITPQRVLTGVVFRAKTDDEKVYILKDENGTEIYALLSGYDTVLTATADDIREGKTAVTEEGFVVGKGKF